MNKFRIFAAFMLVAAMIILSVPVGAVSVPSKILSGDFCYSSAFEEDLVNTQYFYSDEYFSRSGKEKNKHMRTFSFELAMAAFSRENADPDMTRAVDLLDAIGFSRADTKSYDFDVTPGMDTIGTIISHKNTEHGEVVVVALRGDGYGAEWANNLTLGESGDAAGFSSSADKVIDRLKKYQSTYGLSGAKIWMTGYSRGGAVCDISGKYINRHLNEFGITENDLYVYTFEAPDASGEACGYENIHNVIDPNDLLAHFFSKNWGFYSSGTDEVLQSETMMVKYKQLSVSFSGVSVDDKKAEPSRISDVEESIVDFLTGTISRSYYSAHSKGICDLTALLFTLDNTKREAFLKYVSDTFTSGMSADVKSSVKLMGMLSEKKAESEAIDFFYNFVADMFDKSDHSGVLNDGEYEMFKGSLSDISYILVPLLRKDFKLSSKLENTCTLIGNVYTMITPHYSENVIELLKAEDDYFYPVTLSSAEITVDETNADVVSVKLDGKTLVPGMDYAVSYLDVNKKAVEPEESGEYTAVITGVGSFSGTAEKTFTAVFPHRHHWVFEQRGNEVSVKCTEKDCDYVTGKEYVVSLEAAGKLYDGSPVEAQFRKSEGFPEELVVNSVGWYDSENKILSGAPLMPGAYVAAADIFDSENNETKTSVKCEVVIEAIDIGGGNTVIETKDNSAEVLSVSFGGTLLEENKDYTLQYFDKSGKEIARPEEPGEYTVAARGENIYGGEYVKQITITNYVIIIVCVALGVIILAAAAVVIYLKFIRGKKQK